MPQSNFDSLGSFNIFPQFTIRVSKDLMPSIKVTTGIFTGEDMAISFGPDRFNLKNSINQSIFQNMKLDDRGTWFDQPVEVSSNIRDSGGTHHFIILILEITEPVCRSRTINGTNTKPFPTLYLFATENSLLNWNNIIRKISPNASDNTALHDLKISTMINYAQHFQQPNLQCNHLQKKYFSKLLNRIQIKQPRWIISKSLRYGL